MIWRGTYYLNKMFGLYLVPRNLKDEKCHWRPELLMALMPTPSSARLSVQVTVLQKSFHEH